MTFEVGLSARPASSFRMTSVFSIFIISEKEKCTKLVPTWPATFARDAKRDVPAIGIYKRDLPAISTWAHFLYQEWRCKIGHMPLNQLCSCDVDKKRPAGNREICLFTIRKRHTAYLDIPKKPTCCDMDWQSRYTKETYCLSRCTYETY